MSALCPSFQALFRNVAHGPGPAARKGPDLGTDHFEVILQAMGKQKQWASLMLL